MSAIEIPVSAFAAPVEPERILEPHEQFAAHVAEVRGSPDGPEGGDVLDARRTLWAGPLGKVAVPSLAIAGVMFANESWQGLFVSGSLAGIAAGGTVIARRLFIYRHTGQAKARFRPEVQEANDMRYELFRTGKEKDGEHQVAMRWYGPATGEQGIDADAQLRRVAGLARDSGVDELLIDNALTRHAIVQGAPGKTASMASWLSDKKRLHTTGFSERDFVQVATPDAWLAAINGGAQLRASPAITYEPMGVFSKHHFVFRPEDYGDEEKFVPFRPTVDVDIVTDGQLPPPGDVRAPKTVWQAKGRPLPPVRPYGVQEEIGIGAPNKSGREKIATRGQTYRKAVIWLAGLGTSVVLGGGTAALDHAYEGVRVQAAADIAHDNGVSTKVPVSQKAVTERINNYDWGGDANNAWGKWYSFRHGIAEKFSGPHKTRAGLDPMRGGVGNIEEDEANPVWTLTPNNMSTEGLWPQSVSNRLFVNASTERDTPPGITWALESQYVFSQYLQDYLPPDWHEDPSKQWIKVERTITNDDTVRAAGNTYVPIPVLEHTAVVGASFNGQKVIMWYAQNGTYALQFRGDKTEIAGKVTYWIVPDATKHLEAAGPTTVGTSVKHELDTSETSAIDAFSKRIPGFKEADHVTRGNMIRQYYHDHFGYDLAPLPEDFFDHYNGVGDYTNQVLQGEEANCNVANTSVVLQDHSWNGVFSYQHKDSKTPNVLTSDQAHMTLVDEQGNQLDAVPPGQEPIADVPTPGGQHGPEIPMEPVLSLVGVAGLAAVGYYRRRAMQATATRLNDRLVTFRADRADSELRRMHRYTLKGAIAIAGQVAWKADGPTDNNVQLMRVAFKDPATAADAYRALLQPDNHGKPMQRAVRASGAATPDMVRALKLARRANTRPPVRANRKRR